MTHEQLDAIRARVEAATPGPWEAGTAFCCPDCGWVDGPKRTVCPVYEGAKRTHTLDANDAEFIASAREDVPALLAEVERLREAAVWEEDQVHRMVTNAHLRGGEGAEVTREQLNAIRARFDSGLSLEYDETEALLAEVERLTADPLPAAAWVREVERAAFQRGVAAMREAVVKRVTCRFPTINAGGNCGLCTFCDDALDIYIRALPDPEDK